MLKVLKPDCTYQVKVQVQCLSRVYNTNDFITLRVPEGCKQSCVVLAGVWEGFIKSNEPAQLASLLSLEASIGPVRVEQGLGHTRRPRLPSALLADPALLLLLLR